MNNWFKIEFLKTTEYVNLEDVRFIKVYEELNEDKTRAVKFCFKERDAFTKGNLNNSELERLKVMLSGLSLVAEEKEK
ncbi:MAG: hypothetical protein DRQ88_05970 [Epsilonproteobacteria bacterium]|nr:MAG: hypothetical protein DRQ88_05970 [Campylobacterota bacterium]